MNKILKKRIVASIIDSIIVASYIAILQLALPQWYAWCLDKFGGLILIVLLIPYFLKDLIFRNASIGKMIEGIAIYDDNWKRPNPFLLIKRSFIMLTVGYVKFIKTKFTSGNLLTFFDWEMDDLNTRVVDKKFFKYMESQLNDKEDRATQMSRMYSEYLKSDQ